MIPDPVKVCAQLQIIKIHVSKLRDRHDDNSRVFDALTVTLEALRFAWHVVHRDSDEADATLERVESAIAWYRRSRKSE